MTENLPDGERERLIECIEMVLEQEALTIEDASAILDICLNACNRKHVELSEESLMREIGNGTPPRSEGV